MAGGARLLWVSLLVLLALLGPHPGQGQPRERLRVRFTPAVCSLRCVHGPTGSRCTPICAPRNATSVDSGAPGGAAPGGPGFRACECGVVVPREGSQGEEESPGMGETVPQGEGAQIPCAVVLQVPWVPKEGSFKFLAFGGWVLRVLILQAMGILRDLWRPT